jgi:hypothetical protein
MTDELLVTTRPPRWYHARFAAGLRRLLRQAQAEQRREQIDEVVGAVDATLHDYDVWQERRARGWN